MSIEYPLVKSFKFAVSGIKTALKNEPNFRIHLVLAVFAIILGFYLDFNNLEWIILVFTISFVLVTELINTAVEAMVDLVSPEIKSEAKIAKDVSAAAVLTTSVLSIVVAGFLYLPKLFF